MNMHLRHCKLSKNTKAKLAQYFVLEVTARSLTDLLGIQPNSAALYYRKLRELIAYHLDAQAEELLGGEIELDESYFGGHRKSKRGRGAAGKVVVFGILKYDAMSTIGSSEYGEYQTTYVQIQWCS